jgi:hypothetical protein
MVQQIDVSDCGELGHGQEGGCSAVIQGGGLLELPACVYRDSLELHYGRLPATLSYTEPS